ncbi:ribosomal protein L7/L12 [Sphaerisporangium album]|uniref:ribosomal protein L7/L12 n=1 Tax=Sphaerisporangium album TaxID=509200 RepID=UPI001C6897FB|nr:ribosomal protein L7/L12 [Sphaerisporangium album]
MFGIGWPELLILLVVAGGFLGVMFGLARRGTDKSAPSYVSAWQEGSAPANLDDLGRQARLLAAQGKKIHAIKLVRGRTGLGLAEAKAYVDAVAEGRPVPPAVARLLPVADRPPIADAAVPSKDDLATRARGLKADGRAEQAVYLVRGETGMGQEEAEAFVRQL